MSTAGREHISEEGALTLLPLKVPAIKWPTRRKA
jgi:hypothetical protein